MVMKYYRAYLAKEADVYIKDDTFWGENFIKQPMSVDRPVVYTLEKQNLTQDFIYPGDAFLVSTRLFKLLSKLTDNYRTYPAVITKPDGTAIEDYRIFYIGDEIACFNWEKSDYDERNSELDMPEFLRTIVLDKKLLPSFEAKNVFRLKELYSAIIVNEYAKRILEEAKITGFAYKEVAVE